MYRTLHFLIWTILILSPMPREWAQPTADMLMDLWNGGFSIHPANHNTTRAG